MAAMEVALIAAHLDFSLGLPSMLKSSIGWMKGWALLAVFPLIGACLRIRASIVYRAVCVLALQTLILVPFFYAAALVHLPGHLYTSPLLKIGGPGPEFFDVELYGIDGSTGDLRWRFFTPWAPAAAFIANIHVVLASRERDRRWRLIGIAAAIPMCLMSKSRLGLITLPAVAVLVLVMSNLTRPRMLALLAVGGSLAGFAAGQLMEAFQAFNDRFTAARAASSRVRATLGRIALQRWRTEAPIWGHGEVEQGPHLVEHMPIGSHHTWYGLLFVKGAVGFAALAIPLCWSTIEMIAKAQAARTARVALGVLGVIWLYSFGENLEILAYLFWPGLIIVGIASRQRWRNPLRRPMRGGGTEELGIPSYGGLAQGEQPSHEISRRDVMPSG